MNLSKRKLFAVVLVLLLLVSLPVAISGNKLGWRVRIVAWKLGGSLPYASWRELLLEMRPSGMKLRSVPAGFVREKDRGDEPCPVLWDTPWGPFWGRSDDNVSLEGALEVHPYDEIYRRGPVAIASGDVVLDCGSHLGTFSRYALRQGARQVIGFEADPINIACFKRTFEKEMAAQRVILVEAALWDAPGSLKFAEGKWSDSGAVTSVLLPPAWEPGRIIEVPATTIDDTVQRLHLNRVDFIKWNIEGSERHALCGARQTLARFRPRMVVSINHLVDDPVVIPPIALEAVPTYRVFTRELQQAYFY